MATEQILDGQYYRRLKNKTNNIWERISFWTKAKDVYFEDGTNLESKTFGNGGSGNSMFAYDVKDWYAPNCTEASFLPSVFGALHITAVPLGIGNYFNEDSRWSGISGIEDKADFAQLLRQRQGVDLTDNLTEKSNSKACIINIYFYTMGNVMGNAGAGGKGTISNGASANVYLKQLKSQSSRIDEKNLWAYEYSFFNNSFCECMGFFNDTPPLYPKGILFSASGLTGNNPYFTIHNFSGADINFADDRMPGLHARMSAIGMVTRLDTPI